MPSSRFGGSDSYSGMPLLYGPPPHWFGLRLHTRPLSCKNALFTLLRSDSPFWTVPPPKLVEEHQTRKYSPGSLYLWHWLAMGFWKSHPSLNPIMFYLDYYLPAGLCTSSLASFQAGLQTKCDQVTPINKDQVPKASYESLFGPAFMNSLTSPLILFSLPFSCVGLLSVPQKHCDASLFWRVLL